MSIRPVNMEFLYGTAFLSQSPEAYERLIIDAMRGDATLFTRNDEVEAQWRIIDPILEAWAARDASRRASTRRARRGPTEATRILLDETAMSGARSDARLERARTRRRPRSRRRSARLVVELHAENARLRPRARAEPRLRRRPRVERRGRQPAARRRALPRVAAPSSARSSRGATTIDATASVAAERRARARASSSLLRETIVLTVGEQHVPHLDSIVDPLVVTDLATVVWSPHGHHEAVDALLRLAQVVLHDSVDEPEPRDGARRAPRELAERAYVVDLAWLRTTPWRERVAAYFDPPRGAAAAARAQRGHRAPRPGLGRSPALLFLGWLSTRLGWKPDALVRHDGGAAPARRARGAAGRRAALEPVEQDVPGLRGGDASRPPTATSLSLERGAGRPGGDAARRATGASATWTVLGASRGEARDPRRGDPPGAAARPDLRARAARARGGWPREADRRRRPARRQPVPADRRLRVPVGLRDVRARRADRQRRVDVPASASTRRACSARCSTATPAASCSRRSTSRVPAVAALPAGDDDPRDDVGHEDRLGHRPRPAASSGRGTTSDERSHTHRRAPTDWDAEHILLRTMRCVNGSVEIHLECEPMLRLRPHAGASGSTRGDGYHAGGRARPRARRSSCSSTRTCALGLRGRRARGRARRCTRATSRSPRCRGASTPSPTTYDEAYEQRRRDRGLLARVARARRLPRPPVAAVPAALAR